MTTRKHNEYLEADITDEEDASQGYNSDAEELEKGGRIAKRRKVERGDSDDEDDLNSNASDEDDVEEANNEGPDGAESSSKKKEEPPTKSTSKTSKLSELPGVSKPLTKKNLVKTAEAIKRSGVVYLSRIPPFMKPQKLRTLLEPYGAINRIFLTPEDHTNRKSRLKQGGNKKRTFGDGWVEFVHKKDAKRVCELLNTKTIGGKKGSFYYDDVWNLLYLKNFKWHNLTEQVATENAERASRERAELSRSRREEREFVGNVERAKMLEGMEAKKVAKRNKEGDDGEEKEKVKEVKSGGERPRHFKQTAAVTKTKTTEQSEQVKRVLSKIF